MFRFLLLQYSYYIHKLPTLDRFDWGSNIIRGSKIANQGGKDAWRGQRFVWLLSLRNHKL
jgi:hypothetical protein